MRVQVFQEAHSVNINWRYQIPNYQRKENIKEKRREEPGSQIIQLRLYYDGRIVFSYSARPSLVTARPQLESVQVGLSFTNLDMLDLTESLEQLDREGGVMMIPRAQFYQAEWSTHLSRSLQILFSNWWNLTILVPRSMPFQHNIRLVKCSLGGILIALRCVFMA